MKNKTEIVVNDELIARYLSGEASPEEAEALNDWLSDDDNLSHFEEIESTWNATLPSKATPKFNRANAWDRVQRSVQPIPERRSVSLWIKVAASVVVILSAGLFAYYFYQNKTTIQEVSIASAKDQRTITLPDKSSVIINRNSTISYPESFERNKREVNFSGEGFFMVEGNKDKPFIVHTPSASIRVVGTRFNVSAEGETLEVNVQEGKVLVYTATDSTYLEAGQSATLESANQIRVVNSVDANQWGYATRRFVFQDTPLGDVFENFERAYPYSIDVVNKDIKNCRLTVAFDHVSAREMLNLIAETLDLTIQEYDSTFRVDGKGCPLDQ